MVLDSLIEIKIGNKNYRHYLELGYDCKYGETVLVFPKDLQDGSAIKEKRKCDCCGKIYERRHSQHIMSFNLWGQDLCKECTRTKENKNKTTERRKKTCLEKYGEDNPSKVLEFQQNRENTMLDRYGVVNYFQADGFREKAINTCQEKYGVNSPAQNKEIMNKMKNTCLERYGTFNATLNSEIRQKQIDTCIEKYGGISSLSNVGIREKGKQTMMQKYGCENAGQSRELKEKAAMTRIKNGNGIATSEQQLILKEMLEKEYPDFECSLNYVISFLFLDIALIKDELKIDVEYDGSYWHKDAQKDRKRDEFLKSQRFKILRIRSGHLLPTVEEINKAIEKLKKGYSFTQITLKDWNND